MAYMKIHGLELADNGEIRKLRPEVVAEDPVAVAPGRLWYNSVDHQLKFSDLNDQGQMITRIVLDEEEVKKHEAAKAVVTEGIEIRPDDPDPATVVTGRVWLNTTDNALRYMDDVGGAPVTATLVTQTVLDAWVPALATTAEKIPVLVTDPAVDAANVGKVWHNSSDGVLRYMGNPAAPEIHQLLERRSIWKTVAAPFDSAKVSGGAHGVPVWTQIRNGLYAYAFPDGDTKYELWVTFQIPRDYQLGTDLFPYLHWSPADNSLGTVRWGFEYVIAGAWGRGNFYDNVVTFYVEHTLTEGVAHKHMMSRICSENGWGPTEDPRLEPDAVAHMRIWRDGDHVNDTYANSVFGHTFTCYYQSQDRGSTPLEIYPNNMTDPAWFYGTTTP